jgi:hypothetical protein
MFNWSAFSRLNVKSVKFADHIEEEEFYDLNQFELIL